MPIHIERDSLGMVAFDANGELGTWNDAYVRWSSVAILWFSPISFFALYNKSALERANQKCQRACGLSPGKDCRRLRTLPHWRHISVAPFDGELELALIDNSGIYAFVWPCCRILGGWCDAKTRCRIGVKPTHWREWTGSPSTNAFDRQPPHRSGLNLFSTRDFRSRGQLSRTSRGGPISTG